MVKRRTFTDFKKLHSPKRNKYGGITLRMPDSALPGSPQAKREPPLPGPTCGSRPHVRERAEPTENQQLPSDPSEDRCYRATVPAPPPAPNRPGAPGELQLVRNERRGRSQQLTCHVQPSAENHKSRQRAKTSVRRPSEHRHRTRTGQRLGNDRSEL